MNQLPVTHQKVFIKTKSISDRVFENAYTMISGNNLIITTPEGRDETNKTKKTKNEIIPLNTIVSFDTETRYYGDEDKEILKD